MLESVLASLLFWGVFGYSPGLFWSAVMQYGADGGRLPPLFRTYVAYYASTWLVVVWASTGAVMVFGQINPWFSVGLHFAGLGMIGWLAVKFLRPGIVRQTVSFNLSLKLMSLITVTNPKVWLLIPVGGLSANYTGSSFANIVLFWAMGAPVLTSGFLLWFFIGRVGAGISVRGFKTFNLMLLALFGGYLAFETWAQTAALL